MSLEIIMGNMFSGKSTELIRRIKRHQAIGDRVMVINSSKDVRIEGDYVATHEKETCKCLKMSKLPRHDPVLYQDIEVVAVDEIQFFSGLVEFCDFILKLGKKLILAGLDGDSNMRPFGELWKVLPMADDVLKLTALCKFCGEKAPFTKRLCDSSEQELVGGQEAYVATCRKHHS